MTLQMCIQVERINTKRCYVSLFNAEKTLVENFSVPKSRGSGNYPISFQSFAWNADTLVAEGYLEFNEQIYTTTIKERLAELGARSIEVMTFQHNDNNHSAASALNRVRAVAKSEGFTEVVRGTCNAKLLAKADEILAAERRAKNTEFDVEFDAKTKAAIKTSLEMTEEIKQNMATKEGLTHLEEKSDEIKSSFVEMKDQINGDYQRAIADQVVIINKHQDTISAQQKTIADLNGNLISNDRKIMIVEKQNESQRFIIAKLNADARQKEQQIAQLNSIIEQKNQSILRLTDHSTSRGEDHRATLDQYKVLMAEFNADRKRKHDDE